MKYELITYDCGRETETNEEGYYSVNITIAIHPIDGIAPDFSKDIIVESNNKMTGFEVDKQREKEVNDYINKINE